jgi:hypothetical protein
LGNVTESQLRKFNVNLNLSIATEMEFLLEEYKDVFTWSCKDLKGYLLALFNIGLNCIL